MTELFSLPLQTEHENNEEQIFHKRLFKLSTNVLNEWKT